MVFGKRKSREQAPLVEAVGWEDVRRITIGRTERSVPFAKPQLGRLAVRVPRRTKDVSTYAPCAYFRTDHPSHPLVEPVLYEDEAAQRVLCAVDDPVDVGDEIHRIVRDGEGQAVGTLRRIPPAKKLVHHTWRVDQPGRPEIAGRSPWSLRHNTARGLAMRGLVSTLDLVLELAADGDTPANQGRALEWHCEDDLVMTSKGLPQHDSSLDISIKVGWLDRRLAFAVAMVPDFPDA
ncbi:MULTISPECIES: hypothetical protein [Streptomyces]|uniref:Uncharacterized protein n=1 Tax=Streptomyces doudnae TaxID=3075536 RepID=A0ABD5EZG7_9ACTN|nr:MULTISPECIES: hypothetical protein [unclassified Streptomyces]MDT0440147.1 hypothetical protein [Streptomyces sp. DSM 41981]MYQ68052.1 hypothetical protein [Streptomyces sp. SID4950]SCE42610.1 hypothetical protein GA0115242_136712 [Streptomyces sp. SolWspMP-5a-2]